MHIIVKVRNGSVATYETEELSMIDPDTGEDVIVLFLGNNGGFKTDQFYHHEDNGHFCCSQETFDWWQPIVEHNAALLQRIFDLKQKHGNEVVEKVLNPQDDFLHGAIEDHACLVNYLLDQHFVTHDVPAFLRPQAD